MTAFFAPYKTLIEVLIIGAVIAGIVYGAHRFFDSLRQEGYDKAVAEYNLKLVEAKDAAAKREDKLLTQLKGAQDAQVIRDKQTAALAASVSVTANSLRNTVAGYSNSLSAADADALRGSVNLIGGLLTSCTERYQGMGQNAEREHSAKQTLIDAWPR
jgi:predicted lipid-binding transport protein (Tim44 family)